MQVWFHSHLSISFTTDRALGGGTVNGSTHKVAAQAPLRLEKLVVDPDSTP